MVFMMRCHPHDRSMWTQVSFVMAKIGEAAAAGAAVDMSDLLGSYINDLDCRAVMGKSFRSKGRDKLLRELIEDTSSLLAGFNVEEFFPFLARFGVLSKVVRAKSERVRRRWDELLDSLIEDHERKYVAVAASDSSEDDDDFIHVVLSVRQEYGLTSEQMKAILLVSTNPSYQLPLLQKRILTAIFEPPQLIL